MHKAREEGKYLKNSDKIRLEDLDVFGEEACAAGRRAMELGYKRLGVRALKYVEIWKECAEHGYPVFIEWLLNHFGATNDDVNGEDFGGSIYWPGNVSFATGAELRQVIIGGKLRIGGNAEIESGRVGSLEIIGDLYLPGSLRVDGSLYVGGIITGEGSLTVGGVATLISDANLADSLCAGSVDSYGEIIAGGNVETKHGLRSRRVLAGGHIKTKSLDSATDVESGETITGRISAHGHIRARKKPRSIRSGTWVPTEGGANE
jgi:cytoskeletal protein CcmA (bactofilin family)